MSSIRRSLVCLLGAPAFACWALVAGCAQAMSYAVFALLVLTVPDTTPQLAVLIGAAFGALVSYAGQSLFAFRPRRSGGAAA